MYCSTGAKKVLSKKREDFRKIYGLSKEKYQELYPYIEIPAEETSATEIEVKEEGTPTVALIEKPFKYEKGMRIELNRADTTELKKIPGIGSVYARRIVNYRNRLGGFYTTAQLQEIELEADSLMQWFIIDSTEITRIPINKSSIERLRNHPYINFYQAKAFIEHRKKRGNIVSLDEFRLYEEFTEEDLERIFYYITFN
ncbi:MAG: helix-hairpin-helix domain-containing protein [Bacteroides sp.]|nr:helix-hairpin-helix domain-containing protein [Bacteroides sp.]